MGGELILRIAIAVVVVTEVVSKTSMGMSNGFRQKNPSQQQPLPDIRWRTSSGFPSRPGPLLGSTLFRQICRPSGCRPQRNTYVCHAGYEKINNKGTYVCVRKCADGETRVQGRGQCVPKSQNCVNRKCGVRNIYNCNLGYHKSPNNQFPCVPNCQGCQNGNCVAPNSCACHRGYKWDSKTNQCEPQCSKECIHGSCSRPDVCSCDNGYVRHDATVCRRPVCNTKCVNAKCIRDNYCKCNTGYFESQDPMHKDSKCKPYCKNSCLNGDCIAPNNCTCHSGYLYNDKTAICDPVCHPPCVDGFSCGAPNKCECNGVLVEKTKTINGTSKTVNVQECIPNMSSWGSNPSDHFILAGIIVALHGHWGFFIFCAH